MIKINEKCKCCGCYGCYNICPVNAIEIIEDNYGFKYPNANKDKCIKCGLCEKVCPVINKPEHNNIPKAYIAYNRNEEERINSSSGGIFTLLAKTILENDGIVYGASFDNDNAVKHIEINSEKDIRKLRTSKYTQSLIEEKYKKVKENLEKNKNVLFTGTPCQVNGLYAFLQKDYDNLYTQDIICHGVPSPKVWEKYLKFREKKDKEIPSNINFRDKKINGWKNYTINIDKKYNKSHNDDIYMKAFLQNLSLRDSCYNCNFKDRNRISDITLGDFWGIENILPSIDDNKGINLLIVNSNKGEKLINKIRDKLIIQKTNLDEAIKYNQSMIKSSPMNKYRDDFFENLDSIEFDKLVKKYEMKTNIIKKIYKKIKSLI